jgi:6-phosphogluconolactonase
MIAPVAPHARMSLNLSALLDSRRIGAADHRQRQMGHVSASRVSDGPVAEMPVRALLRQQQVPLSVYWRRSGAFRRGRDRAAEHAVA